MKQCRFLIPFLATLVFLAGCAGFNEPMTLNLKADNYNYSTSVTATPTGSANLFRPSDLVYRGAFRLPDDTERPLAFAYGGAAMTFNPRGNPSGGPGDNPGSLFIMGHNRMPYGELPDGNQVAEINIPAPTIAPSPGTLNQARFIQPFHDVAAGYFTGLNEIPRAGMQYLDTAETGPLIHLAFGQHFQEEAGTMGASHAWFNPDLSTPNMQGPWYIGNQSLYSVNGYLFEIPAHWANEHSGGRLLATGRFRDGGWSGMGPALFAYRPWVDNTGTPAPQNFRLEETVLLLYESSRNTSDIVRCLEGYQHPDEWTGGAWLTGSGGKESVLFAGTKSIGDRYWYGFINPAGPDLACVESAYIGQFTLCRLADGTPCPDESAATCVGHTSNRGWWTNQFQARFIFYDPADLAAVAGGELEPWEPQPYAYLNIDEHLYLNPSAVELEVLGSGPQRRFRLGDVAYDRDNGWLYVLELFADEARPVVHAWQIEPSAETTFPDVPPDHVHFAGIEAVAAEGITTGYADGTFRPSQAVTRAEMATFLFRALELADPAARGTFPDVTAGSTHEISIEAIAAAGITTGYTDGTFRPSRAVTRAEMATFLFRALNLTDPGMRGTFPDVTAGSTHEVSIEAIAAEGITTGYDDGTFRPSRTVTRAEMATFLARALNLID